MWQLSRLRKQHEEHLAKLRRSRGARIRARKRNNTCKEGKMGGEGERKKAER